MSEHKNNCSHATQYMCQSMSGVRVEVAKTRYLRRNVCDKKQYQWKLNWKQVIARLGFNKPSQLQSGFNGRFPAALKRLVALVTRPLNTIITYANAEL